MKKDTTDLTQKVIDAYNLLKESGGDFERGHDKTKFGEELSESNDEVSAAYTIKLNDPATEIIRGFQF